jgi:L-seryl-tRNA(Ser) seleniumtransferase
MSTAVRQPEPHPPSVDRILSLVRAGSHPATDPSALAAVVREVIADERERLRAGAPPQAEQELADATLRRLDDLLDAELVIPPLVVNATGVVLHTNLGRAPWPLAALRAARLAASGYGYLELDPATGRRGARFPAAEEAIRAVTGAEAGMVATNNAGALLLAVGLAGRRGSVVVSRGELVEIGGGVRIPEMVARLGARLVEVGTTNRTRPADFEAALVDAKATVVLRVHPSNFSMSGFTQTPDAAAVADIAHRHGAIVVDDLGSGALLDTAAFGLAHEPMPAERLAAGADLVLFSGDKLVGGPQAGIIAGRAELVDRIRRDPLARAVRPDKAILAAVATTLNLYRAGRAVTDIPVWRLIARPVDDLRERAARIVSAARAQDPAAEPRIVELRSPIGGGSLPGQTLPSAGVAVRVPSPSRSAAALRSGARPILAVVADGEVRFDLRTVSTDEDGDIVAALGALAAGRA